MVDTNNMDKRFGDIAIEMAIISSDQLKRALVVRHCIEKRTKVHMPIGKVLKEMGALSQDQVDSILQIQKQADPEASQGSDTENKQSTICILGLDLSISNDRLRAFLSPTGEPLENVTLEMVKNLMTDRGIVEGIVRDEIISDYLRSVPLPADPFQVAHGVPPIEPVPPEIQYHFDTDPLRIGTLQANGTMDWKNRGNIPEAKIGDVLAEKVGGSPGKPGKSVFGKEVPPPRVREPQLKNGKGAERSEDRNQILAKVDGTPKLTSDGKIIVFTLLPIDGDIGLETGNIDFDGYIEASGAVTAGYSVKAKGLRTREIQNATIEVVEDMVSDNGVYGSTIEVGGNVKASHIHNCNMTILGNLVVEKEIFGSTIEVNGQCFIETGKIIDCTLKSKKGILVKDVGTEASQPSELIVGIDHKHERDMATAKTQTLELEKQKKELDATKIEAKAQLDEVTASLGRTAQEQEGYMVQKRQFEEQLEGPNAVEDEEERSMLKDLISELTEQISGIDQKKDVLMKQEDAIRTQLSENANTATSIDEQIKTIKEQMAILDEALKVDPGRAIVKVSGTVHAKTKITGPHKKLILPEKKHNVRIAESKSDTGGRWELAISSLR